MHENPRDLQHESEVRRFLQNFLAAVGPLVLVPQVDDLAECKDSIENEECTDGDDAGQVIRSILLENLSS